MMNDLFGFKPRGKLRVVNNKDRINKRQTP